MSPRPPQADLRALAKSLADGLAPLLAGCGHQPRRRFSILGHSMGAWLGFELALELRVRGCGEPMKLYVSSYRAPSLAGPEHDPDPHGAAISTLPPSSFWTRFEQRYGVNPDVQHPAVRAFLLPLLVADFACIEQYRGPAAATPALECPITAIGAHGDCRFRPQQLSAWKQHTSGTFAEAWFTASRRHSWSTPHRFLADDPSAFQAWLSADWDKHGMQAAPSE
jgi:medium-chain acyl-[acyl-carrier-protein] hydrolase